MAQNKQRNTACFPRSLLFLLMLRCGRGKQVGITQDCQLCTSLEADVIWFIHFNRYNYKYVWIWLLPEQKTEAKYVEQNALWSKQIDCTYTFFVFASQEARGRQSAFICKKLRYIKTCSTSFQHHIHNSLVQHGISLPHSVFSPDPLTVFLQPQAWLHLSTLSHALKMPSMAAIPWKYCIHTGSMAGMGGAALVAAVALPREGNANFPHRINRILTVTATLSHLASTCVTPHWGYTKINVTVSSFPQPLSGFQWNGGDPGVGLNCRPDGNFSPAPSSRSPSACPSPPHGGWGCLQQQPKADDWS